MGKQLGSTLDIPQVATPTANPAASRQLLYVKADGKVYTKNSAGTEALIGPSGEYTAGAVAGTGTWLRLATLDGLGASTGASFTAIISGYGNFGGAGRGTTILHVGQRNADAYTAKAWAFGNATTSVPQVYHVKQISTYVFEVWVNRSAFDAAFGMQVMSKWNTTVNFDSESTTNPGGTLTPVTNTDMDTALGTKLDKDSTASALWRVGANLTGPASISIAADYSISWSGRFLVMSNGIGAHFSTAGYFDITMPSLGSAITPVGSTPARNVTASGILLNAWEALYYILPIGGSSASLPANFRVLTYNTTGSPFVVPDSWILIAIRNTEASSVRVGNGITIPVSQSWSGTNTINANSGTLTVSRGGTGIATAATPGGVVYGASATALQTGPAGTTGQALLSTGATAPAWSTLMLSDIPDAWVKRSVKAASLPPSGNVVIATGGPLTVDGISVVAGDRVLLKDQTITSQNGIYQVNAGAWTRTTDADAISEVAGATVNVDQGTQGGQMWTTTIKPTDTLGATAMNWYRLLDTSMVGAANGVASLDAASRVPIAQIGSGTRDGTKYLRDDNTWAAPASSGSGMTKVYAASVANLTPSGNNTVDGFLPTNGDLVLLKDQTVPSENGVYTFNSGGAWPRATGFTTVPLIAGSVVSVQYGVTNPNRIYANNYDSNSVLGTTPMTWTQVVPGTRQITGALGLTGGGPLSANQQIVVDTTNYGLTHAPVDAATTTNINLFDAQVIDGTAVGTGSRVLVKNQTVSPENGIYNVTYTGAWTRSPDASTLMGCQRGNSVYVSSSSVLNGGKTFTQVSLILSVGADNQAWIVASSTPIQTTAPGIPFIGQKWYDPNDTPPLPGGVPGASTVQSLTTDYSTTTPATPTTGITLFARQRARRLPAFVGPTGQDTRLQPFLASNRVKMFAAIDSSSAVTQTDGGMGMATPAGTLSAVAMTTANFYASMTRHRLTSAATAAAGAGHRTNTPQWFLSNTANMGGFHMVTRFGVATTTATSRLFVGMKSDTGGVATPALDPAVNPSTLLNILAFGWDSADANMMFMYNDASGAASKIDLGLNFARGSATYFYEVHVFAPSGVGTTVYYNIQRLNDGQYASGSVITDIPAAGTLLAAHCHLSNGTTASACAIDFQSLYVETDN